MRWQAKRDTALVSRRWRAIRGTDIGKRSAAVLSNSAVSVVDGKQRSVRQRIVRRVAQLLVGVWLIYIGAYVLNSHLGGYWMEFERDGKDRFAPELGGLSLTDAVMWQPRFGHCSLGNIDSMGIAFVPLIQIDQAWFHRTHYLSDTNFEVWVQGLAVSEMHPRFRREFIEGRGRRGADQP